MREASGAAAGGDAASDQPAVLTVPEVAKVLRISRTLAFAAVAEGTIPSVRIGRRVLVPRAALHAMLGMPRGAGFD